MRYLATVLLLLVLAAGAAAAASLVADTDEARPARPVAVAAEGSFAPVNSRDGQPIFSVAGIAPGDSVSGQVEIANKGSGGGPVTLGQRDLVDLPGGGGGALSTRLRIRIDDLSRGNRLYEGALATMPDLALAAFAPGEARTYEFVATLPDGNDNALQGAGASVRFTWLAGGASGGGVTGQGSPLAASEPLRVRLLRIRPKIRHRRVVAWAKCNVPCRIVARGRFTVAAPPHHRPAKIRGKSCLRRGALIAGKRRLAIKVPRRLLTPLREAFVAGRKARLRVVVVARDANNTRATTHRTTRLHPTKVK